MKKSLRFEIFRRDGFTCRYCGRKPPEVVLEVDHLHPRAEGGTDDPLNLVTACDECNRGKGKRLLSSDAIEQDADPEYLSVQQELAEARRYLEAKGLRDRAEMAVIEELQTVWSEWLTENYVPEIRQVRRWLVRYPAEVIEEAIRRSSGAWAGGHVHGGWDGLIRYVSGVMRGVEQEKA